MSQAKGYDTRSLRSRSWDEFARPDAPVTDFVLSVCDRAAGEVCPVWPGQPITAHWGFADPVAVEGDHDRVLRAFHQVEHQIANRIRLLLSLPIGKLECLALKRELDRIGRQPAV